jgi:hypothetical protein
MDKFAKSPALVPSSALARFSDAESIFTGRAEAMPPLPQVRKDITLRSIDVRSGIAEKRRFSAPKSRVIDN